MMLNKIAAVPVPIDQKFFGTSNHFLSQITDIGKFVSILNSNAIIIAGTLLLFFFVIAGWGIITGAGGGSADKVQQGQKAAQAAIVGFIIVFAAYWIVQLVSKVTGIDIIKP